MGEDFNFSLEVEGLVVSTSDGEYLFDGSGDSVFQALCATRKEIEAEEMSGVDNEDALLRIQDKFAAISNTVSDINYLIQERLEDIDQEEYLDNKVIMSLERISREVSDCYEILDNHKL